MKYEEIYADWKYLFKKIGPADDMTGRYVDSEDLDSLLKNPSKATAKGCLYRQIGYWFEHGIQYDADLKGKSILELMDEFPKLSDIADRYGADLDRCPDPFVRPA